MTFSSIADRRALEAPDAPAVADSRQRLTNAELSSRVVAVAEQLRGLGLGVGDVVALRLANRVEFVVLLLAVWRLGAAVTPINPALTDREVARQLADSGARLLVDDDGMSDVTGAAGVEGLSVLALADLAHEVPSDPSGPVVDPSMLALLIYTSGTTGTPKGVMLDHTNLDAMTAMGRLGLDVGPEDRSLLILPLFHVNGIVVSVLTPLLVGGSVFIADRFDPRSFLDLVEAERPTFFSAVPTIYAMLASTGGEQDHDLSSLRFGVCGAAPAPPELLARFEERFGFPLLEGYGLSEATCGSTINPLRGPRKPGTVGTPFPGQGLRIVGTDGRALPEGDVGEVQVRGPNVMRGYLGRPSDTAATVVDGWLRTGDVGRLDEDGYLVLVGRSKEMIIRGGENIYPKEIEDVLASAPGVLEAAVIGAPHETWGEVVVAYVRPREGAVLVTSQLEARCRERLGRYKRPVAIHVLDELPRTPVGKIDKVALRERL